MKKLLLCILLVWLPFSANAQTAYVDDTLLVPLRSGAGTGFRIIHKGLKSGVKLEILEQDRESGYSFVRTPSGLEGYLPSRYLSNEPIAKIKLANANQALQSTRQENADLKSQVKSLRSELGSVKAEFSTASKNLSGTQSELENIKAISANALNLDRKNRELRESNEQLRNQLELLQVENIRLKDRSESNMMLMGGGLVLLGVIIALLVPMLKPSKKNDSWA